MIDVLSKSPERALGLFCCSLRGRFPFFTRGIGATRKVYSIPKLLMHPFARMIEYADQPAPVLRAQTLGDGGNFLFCGLHCGCVMQIHPRVVTAHVIDVERRDVPERP